MNDLREEIDALLARDPALCTFMHGKALDGIWMWNLEQPDQIWASDRVYELLGLAPSVRETHPTAWQEALDPDDRAKAQEHLRRHLEDPAYPYDVTVRYRHAHGHTLWIRCMGYAVRDAQGKPTRFLGVHRDKTALKQSEQFFRVAFEHAPIGMALVSPAGHVMRVNDALCRILGYTAEELTRLTFHPITHPDDLEADLDLMQAVLNGQRDAYELEKRYLRKDGTVVHALLSVSVVRDDAGKVIHFISQVQDISERVRARTRLEATNRLLNEAERIGKMGAWEMDVRTGHITWSDQVYAIHEVDRATFDPYTEDGIAFYHPEDQPRIRSAVELSLTERKPFDIKCRLITARGRHIWVRSTCYPVLEGDTLVRLTGMFQDITAQEDEKRAREREQEFSRQLIHHMAEGLTILDGQGVQIGVNPALCAMTGFTEEELLGCTAPYPYWPEEERERVEAAFTQAIAQKGGQFELTMKRKDGTHFPVLLNAATILDEQGHIRYHFANLSDLTAAHAARREREDLARFNQIMLEHIPGYIFVKDEQFRIISANALFLSLYPEDQRDSVIGSTTLEAYDVEEREAFLAQDRKALAEGHTEVKEIITFPNGERKTLLTRKIRFEDVSGSPHILGLAIDISALEEAQNALTDALARTKAIVNASNEVSVIGTDTEGLITFFSSGAEHLLGYSAEEVVGRHTPVLIHLEAEVRAAHAALEAELGHSVSPFDTFVHHARQGRTESREWTYVRKDGSTFPVLLSISPVVREGTIAGFVGVALDISAQKRNEAKIRDLLDVTRLQNDRLRNFSHIVSHNLRSHVAGIGGLLHILKEEEPSLFERELFQLLEGASNNLKTTIEDLTEMVKIHLGSAESAKTLLLRDVVQRVLVSTFALRQESGIEVTLDIPPEQAVTAIPSYLDSIVLNFITNAIKYRAADRPPSLVIGSHLTPTHVVVYFRDNGQGINLDLYGKHLFGLYKTFHAHEDARGIGLFITRNQIEAMGGRVEVDSTPGVGSEFRVLLPREAF